MTDVLYEWLQNMTAYLVVAAAVIHALPGKEYEKYVRFFTGLVLILLVCSPVLKLTEAGTKFQENYKGELNKAEEMKLEQAAEWFREEAFQKLFPEEYASIDNRSDKEESQIEVGEIKVE